VEGWRILQKALGSYVAKLRPGSPLLWDDGRLHDRFRHTPKTFRLSMELLQVLPRSQPGAGPDDPRHVYDAIRRCFVPAAGHEFVGIDFANVEPRLVAYAARDAALLRATETSSHSWFAANVIGRDVDFTQSDADIASLYAELAAGGPYTVKGHSLPWKTIRNGCKAAVMTILNAGGAGEIARNSPDLFPSKRDAQYYVDAFFALCPKVPAWQQSQVELAESQGWLPTPIGVRLHYANLISYAWSKSKGVWEKKWTREAKEAIGALHQHTGAMYIATAVVALGEERPDLAAHLRILIHDEIFGEPPIEAAEEYLAVLTSIMERPHPLMPLWDEASALLGGASHLAVRTEAKRSRESWGGMR
jgi:DNA polymerase I-like protein with 3'-5' exonuclease and polymerase domains